MGGSRVTENELKIKQVLRDNTGDDMSRNALPAYHTVGYIVWIHRSEVRASRKP